MAPEGFSIAVSPGQIEILLPASTLGKGKTRMITESNPMQFPFFAST